MDLLFQSYKPFKCPLSSPTEREAARFAIKSCSFSADGSILFGANQNGSIFGMVTCGSLIPLKFNNQIDHESDFLSVQPLKLSHDDLMYNKDEVPKVKGQYLFHSNLDMNER